MAALRAGARDRWPARQGRCGRSALCWASKGSPGGSGFFYLGCLGPAFECLEMLFSRCFLAHAGSVYKQLLKAKPIRAAGGCSQQRPRMAPRTLLRGRGPRVTSFPSRPEGPGWLTKARNASSSFLLPSSRPAASCPIASQQWPASPGCLPALAFAAGGAGRRAPQS